MGIFFVPFDWSLVWLTLLTFSFRTFGWEAGHHRYFSHRSFKTSRAFQLILACLGASSGHKGPIWWATLHRAHHKHADMPLDPHSPVQKGRMYAYIGWVLDSANADTDLDAAKDLSKFPELVWVNKYHYLFPYILLIGVFSIGQFSDILGPKVNGFSAVIWAFFFSTFLSLQGGFFVNVFTHGPIPKFIGYRTFETRDTTSNNWLLCLLSFGASWHNNHHRYMNSARAGFYWWELDMTYLVLRVLSFFHIVWDLHEVPAAVLLEGKSGAMTIVNK
ncbi:acyl-CoA desaturase [Curvibacter sp. AEP1-3]|uniref:acyl-CoA desaturase n=1 Tax=Curvibacter sp. AEP1-3 TaxID=1844971 RepID=UPI001E62604B|nr:fatty acid desaturase [Curvibacter sp. AEP1-3]